jgi:hypothetical protein
MPTLTYITPIRTWEVREILSASALMSEIYSKIQVLNTNLETINTHQINLLKGADGGAEQAKIPFHHATAPTGWTRDATFTNDVMLRVTDGSTVPPGADPNVNGGGHGGGWTITGVSLSTPSDHSHTMSHTHDLQNHTHATVLHSHTHTSHSHSLTVDGAYSHSVPAAGVTTGGPTALDSILIASYPIASNSHTHYDAHGHTIHHASGYMVPFSLGTASPATTSETTGTTATPSTNTSGDSSVGSTDSKNIGVHSITHDGIWRPAYSDILMCKRD